MRIRPGVEADLPAIEALIRALAEFERLSGEVSMDSELLCENLFRHRYAETLLAEADSGEVAGFALFFHTFSTFLGRPGIYLEDLFVRPEHRGRGTGRALLAHLAALAVERGCGRIEWAVLDWNRDAIRFYERLGARPNSDWTVYRMTGDAIITLAQEPSTGADMMGR